MHLSVLLHLRISHRRFIRGLFLSVCSQSFGSLGCFSLPLLSVCLLNNGVLLITYPIEFSDTLLLFSLSLKLLLALGLRDSKLALSLLFLLLLLLLLEVRLELLNRAIVLLGELLKLRSMLLLLLLLFGALVLLLLSHQLVHELVGLGCSVIVDLLTLHDDLGTIGVASLLADRQWRVTGIVALKDVHPGVLDDVLEHVVVVRTARNQVQDIRTRVVLFHGVVCITSKQDLDDARVGLGGDQGELQGSEVVQLWLERGAFGDDAVRCLLPLHVDGISWVQVLEAVLKHIRVAMICRRTNHIMSQAILVALAQSDMTNIVQAAPGSYEDLHGLLVASAGGLDNKGRLAIVEVAVLVRRQGWNFRRWVGQVDSALDKSLDQVGLPAVDGSLHQLATLSLHVDLLSEGLEQGPCTAMWNELTHGVSDVLRLHH